MVVQKLRWITTSICPIKDIYLKYITPKKPHQKDPSVDDNIPLLKFFLFIENEIDYYTILLLKSYVF